MLDMMTKLSIDSHGFFHNEYPSLVHLPNHLEFLPSTGSNWSAGSWINLIQIFTESLRLVFCVDRKSLEKHQVRIEFTADGEMKTVNVIDEDDNKPTVKWSDKFTKNLLNHNKTPNKARNNTRNPGLSRSANITTNQLNGGTNHNDEAVLNIPTVATPRIIKPKTRAIPRGWKSMVDIESESSELPPFVKTLKSSSDTTNSPADTGQCSRHPLGDHKSTPNSPGVESTLTKTPAKLRTPVITFQTHQSPSSVSDSQHLQSDKTPIKVGAFHTGIVTKSEIPTLTNQQVDSGAATPQRPKPTFNVSVFKKPASELVPQRPSSPEEVQKITRTVTRVRKPRATVSRAKTDKKESGSAKKAKKTEEQPESQNSSSNTLVSLRKVPISCQVLSSLPIWGCWK